MAPGRHCHWERDLKGREVPRAGLPCASFAPILGHLPASTLHSHFLGSPKQHLWEQSQDQQPHWAASKGPGGEVSQGGQPSCSPHTSIETSCNGSSGCPAPQGSHVGTSCCTGDPAPHVNISHWQGVPWGPLPAPDRSSSVEFGHIAQKWLRPCEGGLQCHALPLGVTSVPFRAPWITAWASEFFFFRKSMVSRRSSSSVSWGADRSRGAHPQSKGLTLRAPSG